MCSRWPLATPRTPRARFTSGLVACFKTHVSFAYNIYREYEMSSYNAPRLFSVSKTEKYYGIHEYPKGIR